MGWGGGGLVEILADYHFNLFWSSTHMYLLARWPSVHTFQGNPQARVCLYTYTM